MAKIKKISEKLEIDDRAGFIVKIKFWLLGKKYRGARDKLETLALRYPRYKLRVILHNARIDTEYIDVMRDEGRMWCDTKYANGNIYLHAQANPVEIDNTRDVLPSAVYRSLVDTDPIQKISRAIQQRFTPDNDLTKYLLIGILVMQMIMLVVIGGMG